MHKYEKNSQLKLSSLIFTPYITFFDIKISRGSQLANISNFKEIPLINEKLHFINSVLLNHKPDDSFDVQILGSHQRFPRTWIDIPSNIIRLQNGILIQFSRPKNFVNFKIQFYGDINSPLDVNLIPIEAISRDQVLARLKDKTICFAAPVRNCSDGLQQGLELVDQLGDYFKSYRLFIFENDSEDNTKEILANIPNKKNIKIIQRDGLDRVFPFRTERISFARNTLFEEIKKEGSDYFCTMDLDGVIAGDFNFEGFLSNFFYDECWDAVFPVNNVGYYDIWTIRHPDLCPGDYERDLNSMTPILSPEILFEKNLLHLQRMDLKKLNGWLQVSSAFGGMGIYKTDKFIFSNYFGVKDGYEVSDHVAFHLKAESLGAHLYINPSFIVKGFFG